MAKCDVCGKGPQYGHSVSHSKRRINRRFNVNIQKVTLDVNGRPQRMYICTRCLRTRNKAKR